MGVLISLNELKSKFSGMEKLYIPLYQRNYKWPAVADGKKISAKKLVEDFYEHWSKYKYKDKDKDKDGKIPPYHLGMLTIYKKGQSKFQILDGQQRVITLTLVMKALGKLNLDQSEWFKLQFERDPEFEENNGGTRYNYIYSNKYSKSSIDVQRMCENYKKIEEVIKNIEDKNGFYQFIMSNVKVLFRETKQQPIEEFLNINFNKTSFCITDYIKAYMVMDAENHKNDITVTKIIDLWKRLESVIFKLEDISSNNDLENEMFKLVKKNYKEEFLNKNRMEMLFQDRYIKIENNYEYEYEVFKYKEDNNSLKKEYDRLMYYYKVMKSVLEEIQIIDENGIKHPNYNVYNAYNLLCEKNKEVHFFKLIDELPNIEKNIEENTDITEIIYEKFNLTETSHKKINESNDLNSKNQFMEAMLIYENTNSINDNQEKMIWSIEQISQKNYIEYDKSSEEELNFLNNCYKTFDYNFKEYIKFIEKGKNFNELIDSGKLLLQNLLENPKVKHIKIPMIQRDYVMGSSEDYLKKYLQTISFYSMWSKFIKLKDKDLNGIDKKKVDLFEICVFKNNTSYIVANPLYEIKASNSGRRDNYNYVCKIIPELKGSNQVVDFRRHSEKSAYGEFCEKNNEYYTDFNKIITKLKSDYIEEEFEKTFNTSCIIGHLDDCGTFWVYDGQQRLTTSIVLIAYLIRDNKNLDSESKRLIKKFLKKFSFEGRDGANRCLDILLDENNLTEISREISLHIDDKTSFSIYKLIKNYDKFVEDNSILITPHYLLKGMEFEFAQIDNVDDAEQLFMEINEGLKLEPYEQYKAEFNYKITKIIKSDVKKKEILRKIDNIWLDNFKSEESEINMLMYCVTMAYYEKFGYDSTRNDESLDNIDEDIIYYVVEAMDILSENIQEYIDGNFINLWIKVIIHKNKYEKPIISSINNRIYFEKDFYDFIELYLSFAERDKENKCNYYSKCFEMINEFRKNGCLEIPICHKDSHENSAEVLCIQMLENRKEGFNFDEIIKWEKEYKANSYINVENNKDKSFYYEKTNKDVIRKRELKYLCKQNEHISYNSIIISNDKNDIKENIKYYFYKTKNEKINIKIELDKELVAKWVNEDKNCINRFIEYLKDKALLKYDNEKLYYREYMHYKWEEIKNDEGEYHIINSGVTYIIKAEYFKFIHEDKKNEENDISNKHSDKEIYIRKEFIKKYMPEKPFENIDKQIYLEDIKECCENNNSFIQQYIEIGIEKGLLYVLDNKVKICMKSDVEKLEFLSGNLKCITNNEINLNLNLNDKLKKLSRINLFVDKVYSNDEKKYKEINEEVYDEIYEIIKISEDFDKLVDNMLYLYKNSDKKVKIYVEKAITIFYFILTKYRNTSNIFDPEKYYFIAKGYLNNEENSEFRHNLFHHYLNYCKEPTVNADNCYRLRRLFKLEDYSLINCSLDDNILIKERVKFLLQSGISKMKKENNVYKIIYKNNNFEYDLKLLLECVREINQNVDIEEKDFKKYIL